MGAFYYFVQAGSIAASSADARVRRFLGTVARECGAFLAEALRDEEIARIGPALYGRAPSTAAVTDLHDWEVQWFSERLSAPPGRILVGGAGFGREASHLVDLGYEVNAFEPAVRRHAECARNLPRSSKVVCCSYEDLNRAVLDRENCAATVLGQDSYSAILLGWSSLTHVVSPVERERTIRSCASLCPGGPILASFWHANADIEKTIPPPLGLGRAIGRLVGRVRRVEPRRREYHFGWGYGFAQPLSTSEVERLAAAANRSLAWDGSRGTAQVTFLAR